MRKMDGAEFDGLVDFFDGMVQSKWLSEIHECLMRESGSWLDKTIADIGCGTGRFLLRGVDQARHVSGVDLSEQMINRANHLFQEQNVQHKASFIVGDAMDIPLERESADIVISTCVLFLLPSPQQGLKELKRIVAKDGQVLILNPAPEMNKGAASDYAAKHGFSEEEKAYLMKWATVSERRHRKSEAELAKMLLAVGFSSITHIQVLDGLGLITKAF